MTGLIIVLAFIALMIIFQKPVEKLGEWVDNLITNGENKEGEDE